MDKLRLFEMFAGYGGASFALKKIGIPFECIGFSEIYLPAINTFILNHGNIKNYGDCSKINPEELPDFDLLTGGFPCQPFSVNTNSNVRGTSHKDFNLFKDILRILKVKKPKYILLENVKGILGEKSKIVLEELKKELISLGYDLKVELLNSRDYNNPQNRQRVFFIGILGKWDKFQLPNKEVLVKSVTDILEKDIIRKTPSIMSYKLNKSANIQKFGNISRFEAIMKSPVVKRNSNILYEILDAPSDSVSRQCDRIYSPIFSPCLTATGKDYLFFIDGKIIPLSPKECFRLMGFVNDEINLGSITENQKYKLAGDGWDINLVSRIFKEMFKEREVNFLDRLKSFFNGGEE